MPQGIDQLKQVRIEKLEKLRSLGVNPFPSSVTRSDSVNDATRGIGKKVAVVGRVMAKREHGGIIFVDIKDETGSIQAVLKSDLLDKKQLEIFELVDIADFVALQGKVDKTQAGEISVFVSDFQVITKAILPLPDQWYGLKDIEERYRKRYLDLNLNEEVKTRLKSRSLIISAIREFLNSKNYLEIETPTLQPVYGGGFARPFSTHHNELNADLYLRISDEMYLKRLIVGGFEKVYEITKVFRNEGIDMDHNPEFTMFEAQIAYEDYNYGMDITEELIEHVAKQILGTPKFIYQGKEMSIARPWNRYKYVEAIKKFTGVDPLQWQNLEEAKADAKKLVHNEKKLKELSKLNSIGEIIAFVFEETVEEKLIQPTIIYDFPIEVSPLAKKCEDPRFTQRFELFANGMELGNNYSELNDPLDLFKRFVEEKKREQAGFEEAHQTDYEYLDAIEHGFPPTCGLGIGIDRLAMILTDAPNIKEVIAFPLLRPEKDMQKSGQDFNRKLVVVIDSQLPAWQIMNTSAHAAAFLGNKMHTNFDTGDYFVTKDGINLPRNSQYAIVTLSGSKNELRKLAEEVRKTDLLHIGYIPEMMATTNDQELAQMVGKKNENEIIYAGIGIFGPKEDVDKLTKKFPLWGKDNSAISNSSKSQQKSLPLTISRDQSLKLLHSKMQNENLRRHCLCVEAVMRALARHFKADEDKWGILGLLHDGDYEETKEVIDRHTLLMIEWLKAEGEHDRELLQAFESHNSERTGFPGPATTMEWSLFCCDELTGLIVAVALTRPSKKLAEVTVESILKKWNQKGFAAGAKREDIEMCVEKLEIPLNEFIQIALSAMQSIAPDLIDTSDRKN